MYIIIPYRGLRYIAVPTVPIIKRGPELLQNARSRSASGFDRFPALYKSFAQIAPKGNPLIIPSTNAAAPAGATLNSGRIINPHIFDNVCANPEYINSPEHTKNGNSDGIMTL